MVEGYCVKCRAKREITDGKEGLSKKGVRMLKGICGTCKTKMVRVLGKKK